MIEALIWGAACLLSILFTCLTILACVHINAKRDAVESANKKSVEMEREATKQGFLATVQAAQGQDPFKMWKELDK